MLILLLPICKKSNLILKTREETIPVDAEKKRPETDSFPPILNSTEYEVPVPFDSIINTAGGEDSPFITPDGNNFYFFFTPDVNVPAEQQLTDGVTGIWWSKKVNEEWIEPEQVVLHNDISLDGAHFIQGDTMWFASVRTSNYGEIDYYTAKLKNGKWTDVKNAGKQINIDFDVGELHISPDGQTMYYGNLVEKDIGNFDLFQLKRTGNGWAEPTLLPAPVNTDYYELQPFITQDGNELWFTGQSRLGQQGPSLFRSKKTDNGWTEPEEIISCFAGEPTLDAEGNIYFTHHFYHTGKMIEADIYVAYRKQTNQP